MMDEIRSVELKDVHIDDEFWNRYTGLIRNTVIPYQWEALNDRVPGAEPSHAVRNFRIAAGDQEGEFGGLVFQDSDPAKWLEAVGYSLALYPDPQLEKAADGLIDLIGRAQQADGYLNTYYTLKEPGKRWSNLLECHELYCAGHMIEAAVSYYKATGKRKFLDIMCRYVDHIDTVFGPESGKLKGYDGHEEIELALIKLYEETGNDRYLKLAGFFIDERGSEPNFLVKEWEKRKGLSYWMKGLSPKPDPTYNQAHVPVREQTEAVGHAVRAVYLYSGMADLAYHTGDKKLKEACKILWNSIVNRRMYITGGIGSTYQGEAFTFDYDLPNDTAYQETCASIGLIFFAHRMLKLEPISIYADVLERALYNSVISGMGQDGRSFFYVNPLEVLPEACRKDPGKRHVKPERQKWYGCACCPPNIARLLASLGSYVYTNSGDTVYINLYIGGEAAIKLDAGTISIKQETSYPWKGDVRIKLNEVTGSEFTLAVRVPGWCHSTSMTINNKLVGIDTPVRNGYAYLKNTWKTGDIVELSFCMDAAFIGANPLIRKNAGKAAIQRGPLVYCLEEADNGSDLNEIEFNTNTILEPVFESDFFGGAVVIYGDAYRMDRSGWGENLYLPLGKRQQRQFRFRAVPYYLWANRGIGEMQVWTRFA